jgi:prevent-host-death family protein
MMRVVGSFEAKTHFSQLLAEVRGGEKILITKSGKSVAMLVPVEEYSEMTVQETLKKLTHLRKKFAKQKITADDIKAMKEKGRK